MSATPSGARALELDCCLEDETPTRALYEYLIGERYIHELDIHEFLEGVRLARNLAIRYDHHDRTEYVFPATIVDGAKNTHMASTNPWVVVIRTRSDSELAPVWLHESSVISRGIPERNDIRAAEDVNATVPEVALANQPGYSEADS